MVTHIYIFWVLGSWLSEKLCNMYAFNKFFIKFISENVLEVHSKIEKNKNVMQQKMLRGSSN